VAMGRVGRRGQPEVQGLTADIDADKDTGVVHKDGLVTDLCGVAMKSSSLLHIDSLVMVGQKPKPTIDVERRGHALVERATAKTIGHSLRRNDGTLLTEHTCILRGALEKNNAPYTT
jgi:hypothetical protein